MEVQPYRHRLNFRIWVVAVRTAFMGSYSPLSPACQVVNDQNVSTICTVIIGESEVIFRETLACFPLLTLSVNIGDNYFYRSLPLALARIVQVLAHVLIRSPRHHYTLRSVYVAFTSCKCLHYCKTQRCILRDAFCSYHFA